MSKPVNATKGPSLRLHFLDGLRGLACLYVLLFHASKPHIPYEGTLSPFMRFVSLCLSCGHFSVVFFIVLSGFSIMLPIVRSGSGQLHGGLREYARRRARRIMPPYYVAVLLSIGLILGYNFVSRRQGLGPPVVDDALSAGSVISHVLLLHNLSFDWAYRINGPLWSVATEWQIYFAFAFLLLPLWRKLGSVGALVIAWIAGCLPYICLPKDHNFFWAAPWFLGSFMFGVWGAVLAFSPAHADSWLRTRMPWGVLSVLCFAVIAALVGSGRLQSMELPIGDFIVSVFAFSVINACAYRQTNMPAGQRSLLLNALGSKALVQLGAFSYSLYLIQHPVLRLAEKIVGKVTHSYDANIQVHLLVVVPITIVLAWFFAEFFERPFTSGGIVLPAIRRRFSAAPSS